MSSSSDEELVLHRNPATSSVVGERRSSRRAVLSRKKETQHKALEEVKRTRASGNVHRVDVETLIQPVYEEVNEDEYMSIVRERQKDDFVVDDDGSGYVDHGVDIFDDEDEEDIERGVEGPVKRKKEKREKPKKGRLDAFLSTIAPKKTKDESTVSIANDPDVEAMLNECNFDAPSQEVDLGEEYNDRYMKPPLDPHIRNPFKRTRSPSPPVRPVRLKVGRISKPPEPSMSYSSPSSTIRADVIGSECARSSEKFVSSTSNSKLPSRQSIFGESHGDNTTKGQDTTKTSSRISWSDPANTIERPLSERRTPEQQKEHSERPKTQGVDASKADAFDDEDDDGMFTGMMSDDDEPEVEVKKNSEDIKKEPEDVSTEMGALKQSSENEPSTTSFNWDDSALPLKAEIKEEIMDEETNDLGRDDADSKAVSSDGCTFLRKDENGRSVLRFYWIDAFEDPIKFPGIVYLFGRVLNNGVSESCCVIVKNIWRQVFFLPRKPDDKSDGKVDFLQLNNEVQTVLKQFGVSTVKCRPVKKNFAYNDGIIPKTAEVLEVQYASNYPKLPTDLKGNTFSHVFNMTATAMERLLMEVDMRGPSWLEVSDYVVSSPQQTYMKHEFMVDMERMKSISVIQCNDPMPHVTLMAVHFTTVANEKKENEIVMISYIVDANCDLNRPTSNRTRFERHCLVTKSSNRALPFDLQQRLKEARLNAFVFEASNERHLLSQFLCRMQNLNPDVVLGHDMPTRLSTLVSRLEKLKIAQWSRICRLKRSIALKQLGRSKAAQWELTAGRLIVDSRSSAMELVKSRSFDLAELATTLLGFSGTAAELSIEGAESFSNSRQLIEAINRSWLNVWLTVSIIVELNALPLFVQITQTVGGVLSRTLMGGRAERNEFLLLHAFHKAGYVAPNKFQYEYHHHNQKNKKKDTENIEMNEDETEEKGDEKTSKKAQYTGGLVLEPKKGLYDKYILLLDFNSLYPSIIQEYNICFTTVDQSKKDDSELPALPDDSEEGILPREIRVLVERRRAVKNLMKSEKLSDHLRQQYNIRQMALKLTANSMYGCLGFTYSRFYAKPLAALITSRGRDILMHTKDLVEKDGYSVIYGDTDSIMINTGLDNLEEAKKLGNKLKRMVNKCHTKLELDIDGLYRKLLLLKKKKYAGLAVDLNNCDKMKKEMKGLDIVRRDWSMLAKEIGNEIVEMILSMSLNREDLDTSIYDRLRFLRKELDDDAIDIEKFEIFKQLTRDPKEYADIKSQPHAAVAQRLNESGKFHFHKGDTVNYIICEDGTQSSSTQRAYHRSEIASNKNLHIDIHYYLAHQIHPVVCRLCEPIEEIDAVGVANALGIDSSGYRIRAKAADSQGDEQGDETTFEWKHDFSQCQPFKFKCPHAECRKEIEITKAIEGEDLNVRFWCDQCPHCTQPLTAFTSYLINQLSLAQSNAIHEYYTGGFVCDDVVCAYRTRVLSLSFTRQGAICPKCMNGIMKREKSSRLLYEQQSFFETLFDLTKALSECNTEQQKKLRTRKDANEVLALNAALLKVCQEQLSRNDFNRISLTRLFASMRTTAAAGFVGGA